MKILREKRTGKAVDVSYTADGLMAIADNKGKVITMNNATYGLKYVTDTTANNFEYTTSTTTNHSFKYNLQSDNLQVMPVINGDCRWNNKYVIEDYSYKNQKNKDMHNAEWACMLKAARLDPDQYEPLRASLFGKSAK